jgi:hypothetical protein
MAQSSSGKKTRKLPQTGRPFAGIRTGRSPFLFFFLPQNRAKMLEIPHASVLLTSLMRNIY